MFEFEFKADLDGPIMMGKVESKTHCMFKHNNDSAVRLLPGVLHEYNIGFKLFDATKANLLFEHRATPEKAVVEPDEWIQCTIQIPRRCVNFHDTFLLGVNMVKEEEFWFDPENSSFEFPVSFIDGLDAAEAMANQEYMEGVAMEKTRYDSDILFAELSNPPELPAPIVVSDNETNGQAVVPTIVFDVSDLIQYFHNARLPTGIQRVQIEVITSLILESDTGAKVIVASFSRDADFWVEIPHLFFNHICKLSLLGGEPLAADWQRVLEELHMHIGKASTVVFPQGAYLVNLGTSWWLRNYFLNIRAAKSKYNIKYVPYVHDCIPIVTPEHCVAGLTQDFISWAVGAFQHADHVMANSQATANDVVRVAAGLGQPVDMPSVVTLDADYRRATAALPGNLVKTGGDQVFTSNDITPGNYVLFVSTIESRKNHLLAFSVWLSMIKKYGAKNTPTLVCVGNRGWLNDAIYAKLEASKLLKSKVVMLSKIPDQDLANLYQHCLFTVYPSSYEGWGLPVTESLCYGKVALVANSSSLPEAGGIYAEYFDTTSETDFMAQVEKLVFDSEFRTNKEIHIRHGFSPRTWKDIAYQVVSLVKSWAANAETPSAKEQHIAASGVWPFPAKLGQYYGLTEIDSTQLWPGMINGEIYRQGANWWWPEPWGCWAKTKPARLACLVPRAGNGDFVLFIGVKGVQGRPANASVTVKNVGTRKFAMDADQERWVAFQFPQEMAAQSAIDSSFFLLEMSFHADGSSDFRVNTGGEDHRVAGMGVRGFMICRENDFGSRLTFLERVTWGDMESLSKKPLEFDFFLAPK